MITEILGLNSVLLTHRTLGLNENRGLSGLQKTQSKKQKTQSKNLYLVSDHRLKNDEAYLTFGEESYIDSVHAYPYIQVELDWCGTVYKFVQRSGMIWDCQVNDLYDCQVNDSYIGEICMENMNDSLKSLENLGVICGPLMKRAIYGIATQYSKKNSTDNLNEASAELNSKATDNIFASDNEKEQEAKRLEKERDRAFIKAALRRANLVVSKDGRVVDLTVIQQQNQRKKTK